MNNRDEGANVTETGERMNPAEFHAEELADIHTALEACLANRGVTVTKESGGGKSDVEKQAQNARKVIEAVLTLGNMGYATDKFFSHGLGKEEAEEIYGPGFYEVGIQGRVDQDEYVLSVSDREVGLDVNGMPRQRGPVVGYTHIRIKEDRSELEITSIGHNGSLLPDRVVYSFVSGNTQEQQ